MRTVKACAPAISAESTLGPPFVRTTFEDNRWTVSVPSRGTKYNISWESVRLNDGSSLCHPKNNRLLTGAKLYVLARAAGRGGVRALKGLTVVHEFGNCSLLIRWMASRGLREFAHLSLAHAIGYRNYVSRRDAKVRKKNASSSRAQLSSRHRAKLLNVILHLARLQDYMSGLGTRYTTKEIAELEDYLSVRIQSQKTKAIPDDIFRDVLTSAVMWVDREAPKLLKVHAAYAKYRRIRSQADTLNAQRSREAYERIARPLLPPEEEILLDGESRPLIALRHYDVSRLITITRGACFVIIAALVGMRISEIASLREKCLHSKKISGGRRVLELTGTLFKTVRSHFGEPAVWIAGYDEVDNPVAKAIKLLESLPRPGQGDFLFARMYEMPKNERQQLTFPEIVNALNLFVGSIGVHGWHVTPHQFRKTFARFVAISSEASAFTLMRHFKHVSVLMTEHYLTYDPEQINDIFEATQTLVAERLDSMFGAERLGGLAGQRIVANNAAYRGTENAAARQQLVQMTLQDPSAYFRITPLGMCLYDEALALCQGKIENVGLDACINCNNFAVGQHNMPYWITGRDLLKRTIEEQASIGFVSIELHRQFLDAEDMIMRIQSDTSGPAS